MYVCKCWHKFGYRTSLVVGPKKQDFGPKINTAEDGRKLKNIHIDLILKKNCSFSLYLKFGVSEWK